MRAGEKGWQGFTSGWANSLDVVALSFPSNGTANNLLDNGIDVLSSPVLISYLVKSSKPSRPYVTLLILEIQ
jgi:hypothetical protein